MYRANVHKVISHKDPQKIYKPSIVSSEPIISESFIFLILKFPTIFRNYGEYYVPAEISNTEKKLKNWLMDINYLWTECSGLDFVLELDVLILSVIVLD